VSTGEEWAFRQHDDAPSERVRVLAIHEGKRANRVDLLFLDDPDERIEERVPAGRLRVLWSDVEAFDARMATLGRLKDEGVTDAESSALATVYALLLPHDIAEWTLSPVRHATQIHDPDRFAAHTGIDLERVLARAAHLDDETGILLSPLGSILIAEQLCARNPETVLAKVHAEEHETRIRCIHGGTFKHGRSKDRTSAEWEWRYYLEWTRPVHELLRQWCGHRAVTAHERILAAENEVVRLDELLDRAIDALRDNGQEILADSLRREQIDDEITPSKVRPLIERPMSPSEIPVRIEYRTRPRRW